MTAKTRSWWFGLWVLLALAIVPRVVAAADDFWLDEIWSLEFAALASSPLDILFDDRLRHDNNHPLNTLWLYLLGERDGWVAYRVPAVLAGLLTVLLAGLVGARRRRREGLVAAAIFATSYMMIAYSTEARGYSLAIASALAALLACVRAVDRRSWSRAALFWATVVIGLLSHFSFAHAYFGLFVWSAWRLARIPCGWRVGLRRICELHAVPAAFAVFLYLTFIRDMHIGGGPTLSVGEVLVRTLSWTLGGPATPAAAVALGALVVAVSVANAVSLWRAGNDRWILDVSVVFVAPLLTMVVLQPEFLVPRYFLMSITFFLLTLAHVVVRLMKMGGGGAVAGAAVLVLYIAGNAAHIAPFLRLGKGEYVAAVRYMGAHTSGDYIDVTKLPDTNPMILRYHARQPVAGKSVRYVPGRSLSEHPAEWLIVTWQVGQPDPGERRAVGGARYQLAAKFSYSAPSGIGWWLYRRS